jgi:hypothetical protein
MTAYTWTNPVSGNWDTPGDWSPYTGRFPGTSDTATVTGSATTTLYETNGDSVYDLYLENPNATLNDSGGALSVRDLYHQTAGALNVYSGGYLEFDNIADLYGGSLSVTGYKSQIANNFGAVYQDGSSVTIGGGDIYAEIYNDGLWDIQNNGGISQTGASLIENATYGIFEKTGGSGTSTIAGRIENYGEILVSSGTLEFQYKVNSSIPRYADGNAVIENGSTLEFDRAAHLSSVDFNNTYSTLFLEQFQNYSGLVDGFASTDAIKLLGRWNGTNIHYNGIDTILTLQHLGVSHSLEFQGDLVGALNVHPGAVTTITHA